MTNKQNNIIEGEIDIGPLLLAYEQFSHGLSVAKTDLEKAGVIQYFEFTFELAWKTMKRILRARGKDLNGPKPVIREAAREGLIDDPESWFAFIEDRIATVHTYNRKVANSIFRDLTSFAKHMDIFLERLQKLR